MNLQFLQKSLTLKLLFLVLIWHAGVQNKGYAQYCIPGGSVSGNNRCINNFSTTGGTTNITNLNTGISTGGYGNYSATQIVTTNVAGVFNFTLSITGASAM